MKVIIDRFEGNYAVVEIDVGKFVNIPKILLPNAKEGDVIKIEKDKKETKNRKKNIQKLMNDVFEDQVVKMKKNVYISLLLILFCVGSVEVNASSGRLRKDSIKTCGGITYGQHSSDNHWHIAELKDGSYYATGNPIYSDPCSSSNSNNSDKHESDNNNDSNQVVDPDTTNDSNNNQSSNSNE